MMNERIKQLAEQATEEVMRNTPSFLVTNEMWKEKFAELIVRECIDLISVNHDPNSDWDWEVSRGHAIAIIKEHFGVEE